MGWRGSMKWPSHRLFNRAFVTWTRLFLAEANPSHEDQCMGFGFAVKVNRFVPRLLPRKKHMSQFRDGDFERLTRRDQIFQGQQTGCEWSVRNVRVAKESVAGHNCD